MADRINHFRELRVYQNAMNVAMDIFTISKTFPDFERFSLIDQIRRSSRSVCANLSEAWRKRRYKAAFISKLSDSEAEASETQVWVEFAFRCKYINEAQAASIDDKYEQVISQIVSMIDNVEKWLIKRD